MWILPPGPLQVKVRKDIPHEPACPTQPSGTAPSSDSRLFLFVLLLLLYCFNTACGSISLASTDCVNSLERLWKLPRKTAWEQHSRSSWEAVSCLPALASFPQSTPNHKPVQFCMVSEETSWPWGQLHVGLRELNHASWSLHGVITVKSSTRSNVESGCFGAFITYATTNDSFMVKCTWIEG